jgi:ketosteroid isomerase-like protein
MLQATETTKTNRDVILRVFDMINAGDTENVDEVYAEDIVTEHPQTRERIQGIEDNRALAQSFAERGSPTISQTERTVVGAEEQDRYVLTPLFKVVRVEGIGDTFIVTTKNTYPDGSDWHTIGLVTFREGKITKQVLYFAPTFEPPEWRSQWVEPIPAGADQEQEVGVAIQSIATKRSRHDLVLRLFEIINTGDYDHFDEVQHPDCVTDYPQSGERVLGLRNFTNVMKNYPGGRLNVSSKDRLLVGGDEGGYLLTPMFTAVKVDDVGNRMVASVRTRYPDGSDWYIIALLTFREDKMAKQVLYFAPVFEAPEWRQRWVQAQES